MRATIARLVTAAVLTGAMLATGSAAHADVTSADAKAAAGAAAAQFTTIPASGDISTLDYPANCFGYIGNFREGTGILVADWDGVGNADECFGIAPNRTIWHAWAGSGGWKEMPNNGRADYMHSAYTTGGRAGVRVWVNGIGLYCSTRNAGPGWGAWHRCTL
jgi:hypothetical protein